MRVIGLDFGSKRIGVASANTQFTLAMPHSVLNRTGSVPADHRLIKKLVVEEEAELVVVGLPIDLAGRSGIAAQNILAEVQQLATVVGVPVETYDERLTSAVAHKNLQAQGLNERKRRAIVDKFAAAEILQGWLDSQVHQ